MNARLRDSGIEVVGRVPWGTHCTLWYETQQDLLDTVVPYLAAGLAADEWCEWRFPNEEASAAAQLILRKRVPDFDLRLKQGQVAFHPAEPWYLPDGEFHADRLIARWREKAAWLETQRFPGLRVTGDLSWLSVTHWPEHQAYETALHRMLQTARMLVLCTFSLDRRAAVDVFDVAKTHHFAIVRRHGKWEVLETPERAHEKTEAKLAQTKRVAHERALRASYEAALEERTRLAREIHDTLVQGATGAALQLRAVLPHLRNAPKKAVASLRQALQSAESSVREARQAVWDMRVPVVAERGLVKAIELEIKQRSIAPRVSFRMSGRKQKLPADVEDIVFRIARESLANAEKHAEAKRIGVALRCTSRSVHLRVTDDGVGFSPEPRVQARAGKWGLLGMRERAERLGATLVIKSRLGKGTTVDLRVPLSAATGRRNARAGR